MNYIVTGLGFGDEGKGSIVDALCRHSGANVVVRHNGGAQAAHNVVLPNRIHHTFAQFGSGSLVPGVVTVLSKYMMVNPITYLNEWDVLPTNPSVYVDERALVTTPYHVQLNRVREAARGVACHGTTGMGVSETVKDSLARPNDVLRMGDLRGNFANKLQETRDYLMVEMERFGAGDNFRRIPCAQVVKLFKDFMDLVSISDPAEIKRILLESKGVIFEGAQGVLLDQDFGFHPHTTWSKTTSANALALVAENCLQAVTRIGVTRTYTTRHGEGPFPTEISPGLFPEFHNADEGMPGQFRSGLLDVTLLEYAIRCNRGIDCLAVNHADCRQELYCAHNGMTLRVPKNVYEQEGMASQAWRKVPPEHYAKAPDNFPDYLAEILATDLFIVGKGPTYEDKEIRP